MKTCVHCGTVLKDEDCSVCSECGCVLPVPTIENEQTKMKTKKKKFPKWEDVIFLLAIIGFFTGFYRGEWLFAIVSGDYGWDGVI